MQQQFVDFLENQTTAIEKHLLELISINSILGDSTEQDPFGKEVSKALNKVVEIAQSLGFTTQNKGNYYATIDWGDVTEPGTALGILAHTDIVPFGEGWDYAPTGQIAGSRIYGRGALDDKGPIIATLYAMSALKNCGFKPQRPIRLVVGGNEENHSHCLQKYIETDLPLWGGFSPDGDFPLVYAEKGITNFEGRQDFIPRPLSNDKCLLIDSLDCGTAANAVPGKAVAIIKACGYDEQLLALSQNPKIGVEDLGRNTFKVTAIGKAAHGSTPEKGESAIKTLVETLLPLPLSQSGINDWLQSIDDLFLADTDGEAIGIKADDQELGSLTINLGVLKLEKDTGSFMLDLRYPATTNWQDIFAKLEAAAKAKNIAIANTEHSKPLYVPKESGLVQTLLNLYRQETGDQAAPMAIGGGTYCRLLKNFVSFGPSDENCGTIHQANEFIEKDHLLFLAKIYAEAIYQLTKK